MEAAQSSAIGRAHCSQQLHCRSDELTSTVRDLHEPVNDHRFCMVEFRAGMCGQALYIERNAHALTVAARALRTAADRLEQIAEDAAGQATEQTTAPRAENSQGRGQTKPHQEDSTMPELTSTELVDACLRETLFSFAEDAIREVTAENAGLRLSYLKDEALAALHRDSIAREMLRDTLKAYVATCVEQARYAQTRDGLRTLEVAASGN